MWLEHSVEVESREVLKKWMKYVRKSQYFKEFSLAKSGQSEHQNRSLIVADWVKPLINPVTMKHLIVECQLTNVLVEGMVKLESHHQLATTVITDSGKNHQCRGFPGDSVVKESTCQCRGHRFDPWSGKIAHATKPMCHNLLSLCSRAWKPQTEPMSHNSWSLHTVEPAVPNKRSHCNEMLMPRN